jgi:N-acetylated-alpha-linked acidic dipeptidase
MATYGDPGFLYHTAIGQYVTLLAYRLADDEVIPFNIPLVGEIVEREYVSSLLGTINNNHANGQNLQQALNFNGLLDAVSQLQSSASALGKAMLASDFLANKTRVALVNAKLRDFQRNFVSQGGLPGREFYKNVLYAPGIDTGK